MCMCAKTSAPASPGAGIVRATFLFKPRHDRLLHGGLLLCCELRERDGKKKQKKTELALLVSQRRMLKCESSAMCNSERDKEIRTCAKGNSMIRLLPSGVKIKAESTHSLNYHRVCFPGLRTREGYLRKDGNNAETRRCSARQLNTADGNQQTCFL